MCSFLEAQQTATLLLMFALLSTISLCTVTQSTVTLSTVAKLTVETRTSLRYMISGAELVVHRSSSNSATAPDAGHLQ
jgi:hypothetical protein